MRTFLIGPDGDECQRTLEGVLRAEGHDVHRVPDARTARAAWDEAPVPFIILACPGEGALQFCRHVRRENEASGERTTVDPIVLAVASEPARALSLQALTDAGVDELIFDCEGPGQLRAQLTLAAERVQRRAQRARTEAELRRRAEQQAVLARLGRQALNGSTLAELLRQVASGVAQALRVDHVAALRLQGDELIVEATAGAEAEDAPPSKASVASSGPVRRALRLDGPVVVRDGLGEGLAASSGADEARSALLMKIAAHSAPYGILAAYRAEERSFTEDDEHFIQAAAWMLAGAIGRGRTERALRDSEAKARAVLETTVDGIITIDEYGTVESFNQAAEDIFGYAEEDVIGQNIKMLMPEPYYSEHDSYLRSYRETGRRKIIGIGREVEGRRRDGSVFPLDLAVSEVQLGGRRLFTGVVRDISERRRLEREVLEISEEERRRIGQDLHDNLGQMLTGVGLLSRSLARKLKKAGAPGAEEAAQIEGLIKEADEQARTLSRGLVPVDLEAQGLADALRRLTRQTEELSGTRCTFREAGTGGVHDNTAATHLFRIAQEATSNAVKHGRASHIAIMLASGPERTRLRVKDNGVGFPEDEARMHESQTGGLGVRTMQHRARLIGATLEIQSTPGEGAAVTCTMRPAKGSGSPASPLEEGERRAYETKSPPEEEDPSGGRAHGPVASAAGCPIR